MTIALNKALFRDKLRVINTALRAYSQDKDQFFYAYELDEDKSEAYGDTYSDEKGYVDFMVKYILNEDATSAVITTDPVQVTPQTEYKVVSEDSLVDRILKGIDKHFGGSSRDKVVSDLPEIVLKQFEEDQMIEIGQMYVSPMDVDAHNDSMTAQEIVKMVDSANTAIAAGTLKANYDHQRDEDGVFKSTEDFSILKAFVAECDCTIGGKYVPEGTPLLKAKYHNVDVWKARKEGGFTGWSIGAKAKSCEFIEVDE